MRFVITNSCDFSNLLDIRGPDVVTAERQPRPESERRGCPISNPWRPTLLITLFASGLSRPRAMESADEKIASLQSVGQRNEAKCVGISIGQRADERRIVSDSGELATRSSRKSESIESGLRSVPFF
jgi:hypothetical protein